MNRWIRGILSGFPRLFDPAIPFLFLVGVVASEVLGSAAYEGLERLIPGPWWMKGLLAVALLGLALVIYNIIKQLLRRLRLRIRVPTMVVEPRRGLIVLVSHGRRDDIPALPAIRHHYRGQKDERPAPTLEYLWLVASRAAQKQPDPEKSGGAQSSAENAKWLKAQYDLLLGEARTRIVTIQDFDNPEEVFSAVEGIYSEASRHFHLREREVIADFTGGTKSMTVGMVLACTSRNRDLQFMKPNGYLEDGRADPTKGAEPRIIDIGFFLETRGD